MVQLIDRGAGSGRPALKINQEDATWENLQGRLTDIFKTRAEKVMFVKGDNNVPFADVANVIDIAHAAGVDKVGLITAKIEAGSRISRCTPVVHGTRSSASRPCETRLAPRARSFRIANLVRASPDSVARETYNAMKSKRTSTSTARCLAWCCSPPLAATSCRRATSSTKACRPTRTPSIEEAIDHFQQAVHSTRLC